MADTVDFELVSPEKVLFSESVPMVVVPGSEGNFGVLPGHAPMITTVRPGTIDIYDGQKIVTRIFVAGGFAEVTPTRCTVLADTAIRVEDLDRAGAEADLARASDDLPALYTAALSGAESDRAKLAAVEKQITIAQAKLQVLTSTAH